MPVELSGRHYRGPEQPKAPPEPRTLPPAEELLPSRSNIVVVDDDSAFHQWFENCQLEDENPAGVHKLQRILEDAFHAGIAYERARIQESARSGKPQTQELEGTVESRTIVAALTFFKEQVLVHGPEEVKTGEWMSARDVDALIQGIQRKSS